MRVLINRVVIQYHLVGVARLLDCDAIVTLRPKHHTSHCNSCLDDLAYRPCNLCYHLAYSTSSLTNVPLLKGHQRHRWDRSCTAQGCPCAHGIALAKEAYECPCKMYARGHVCFISKCPLNLWSVCLSNRQLPRMWVLIASDSNQSGIRVALHLLVILYFQDTPATKQCVRLPQGRIPPEWGHSMR